MSRTVTTEDVKAFLGSYSFEFAQDIQTGCARAPNNEVLYVLIFNDRTRIALTDEMAKALSILLQERAEWKAQFQAAEAAREKTK